jgi:cobalt-zinc-cadmium efflux system membrane fusion protein
MPSRVEKTLIPGLFNPLKPLHLKYSNTAIAQNEGKIFIFIRSQDGFNVSPVTVIGKQGEESIISGDLTGDEDIAIKGAVALKANWLGLGSAE